MGKKARFRRVASTPITLRIDGVPTKIPPNGTFISTVEMVGSLPGIRFEGFVEFDTQKNTTPCDPLKEWNDLVNNSVPDDVVDGVIDSVIEGDKQTEPTPQVTPEVTPEVVKMLAAIQGEMGRREIQAQLGLNDEKHFREHYQQPAVAQGLVEMTIPAKPNSRMQKYRLTDNGRAVHRKRAGLPGLGEP